MWRRDSAFFLAGALATGWLIFPFMRSDMRRIRAKVRVRYAETRGELTSTVADYLRSVTRADRDVIIEARQRAEQLSGGGDAAWLAWLASLDYWLVSPSGSTTRQPPSPAAGSTSLLGYASVRSSLASSPSRRSP